MDDITPNSEPQEPSTLHTIIFGDEGLRAGWSLLIFLVLLFLFFSAYAGILLYLHHGMTPPPRPHLISPLMVYRPDGVQFLIVLLASWIMSRIERRPLAAYGLGSTPLALPQLFSGLITGFTALSLLVGILWKLHLLDFNSRLLSSANAWHYAFIWLGGFLIVAFAEEYMMRGYLQSTLARGLTSIYRTFLTPDYSRPLGFWTAALILSILFGLGHSGNIGESPLGLLSAALAGLIFCLALWRTGSLWWAIGFHCTWDWAQSYLYGVADSGGIIAGRLFDTTPNGTPILSGGATGPEGSIYVLPVLAVVVIIILITLPTSSCSNRQREKSLK